MGLLKISPPKTRLDMLERGQIFVRFVFNKFQNSVKRLAYIKQIFKLCQHIQTHANNV